MIQLINQYIFINLFLSGDRIFSGNYDSDTINIQYLDRPIKAKFIQINALKWHTAIGFRFSILGCTNDTELSTAKYIADTSTMNPSTSPFRNPSNSDPTGNDQSTNPPYNKTEESSTEVQAAKENPIVFPSDSDKPSSIQYIQTEASSTEQYVPQDDPIVFPNDDKTSSTQYIQTKPSYTIEEYTTKEDPIIFPDDQNIQSTRFPRNPNNPIQPQTSPEPSTTRKNVHVYTTEKDAEFVSIPKQDQTKVSEDGPVVFPTDAPTSKPQAPTPATRCQTCPGVAEPRQCLCSLGLFWDGVKCVEQSECNCLLEGIR